MTSQCKFMLKASSFLAGLFVFLSAALTMAQDRTSNIHIGFCYPLSTNGSEAASYINRASFHVLAGVSKEEKSFSFAGISNVVKDKVSGFQLAGISNTVGNRVEGMQFAGIVNLSGKEMKGFQFAGIYNDVEDAEGFQFSGFLNRTKKVKGFQAAGFSNIVTQNAENFQFAGFANIVGQNFKGFQAAGFINKVKDINGFQFAGFINVARKVRGLQFAGFINIADSSDHSLALINIIKKGEQSIAVTTDETQTTLATFRSGGRILYGIIGAGYNWKTNENHAAFEAGFGAHIPFSNSFRINTELVQQYLEDWHKGEYFKSTFRILPAVKLGKRVEIFGGPSVNFSSAETEDQMNLVKKDLWHKYHKGDKHQLFIGYNAGLQFIL